jgi:O-antigen/teichoic acid export membrane protein
MSEQSSISRKSIWTIGTYVGSAGLRFASNIVLSRLLGPHILGMIVIAQAVRSGTELLSDLGLEQSVVHSPNGNDRNFLNTIWTLQVLRGALISAICFLVSGEIARFYGIERSIIMLMSLAPFLGSIASTSIFTLSKKMDVKTRNIFEISVEFLGFVVTITLCLLMPSVWSAIIGILSTILMRSLVSYALDRRMPAIGIQVDYLKEIFSFSKWILLSSLALYAAIYIDRLYLGKVAGLSVLGVYGLARAISDLPQAVAGRIAFQIVFPFVAERKGEMDAAAHAELAHPRRLFLLLVAAGIASVMALSDIAVGILYDHRYADAGWMLFLLLLGSWLGTLASLNEATLFGQGRPRNVSLANGVRIAAMAVALPGGYALLGLPGAILALPFAELVRYGVLVAGQRRGHGTFVGQDLGVTLLLLAMLGLWLAGRMMVGVGMPWAGMH